MQALKFRTLLIFILVAGAVAMMVLPLLAHEPTILPLRQVQGADQRTTLLVVPKPGVHVELVPSSVAFGDVRVGESAERQFEVRNLLDKAIQVEVASLSANVTVSDPSTGSPVAPVDLAPFGSRVLSAWFAPTSPVPLDGIIEVRSYHKGLGVPVVDELAVSGFGRSGAKLAVSVVGTGGTLVDFGEVSRRPYGGAAESDERPTRDIVIENIGDQTAQNVWIKFPSTPLHPGCDFGSSEAGICFWRLDEAGAEVAENATLGDLLAGQKVTVRLKLYPGESSYASLTYQAESTTDPGIVPVSFEAQAEIVPFFTGLATSSATAQLSTKAGSPGDGGLGRNIDPFANDPLSSFRPTGFDAKSLFDMEELDAVDAQSGNLVLAIPIGGVQVAAASGLSYSLKATYNSNVWSRMTMYDYSTEQGPGGNLPPNGDPALRFANSNAEFPNPIFNSSPGWSVHLGRLLPPVDWVEVYQSSWQEGEKIVNTGYFWTYVTPNGTQLRFWPDLNHPLPNYGASADELANAEYLYERSGTFMRLHKISATRRELELPNGQVHVFEKKNVDGIIPTHPDDWVLTEIKDKFGHSITISYSAAHWSINDGNRTVTIYFAPVQGVHQYAVDRITFPGYKGGAARVYDFVYTPAVTIDRPASSTWHYANITNQAERELTLERLDRIELPDGTSYDFSYDTETGDERELLLTSVALPTGGTTHWEYDQVADTTPDCLAMDDLQSLRVEGVVRRWVTEPAGSGTRTLAETRYLRALRRDAAIPTDYCDSIVQRGSFEPYTDQVVGVWRQEESGSSSLAVEYFSKWPMQEDSKTGEWSRRERNVNMTRGESTSGGRFLASRLYSCPFDVGTLPTFDPLSDQQGDVWGYDPLAIPVPAGRGACSLVESRYAQYEIPLTYPCEEWAPECNIGARTLSSKTVFETDLKDGVPRAIAETNASYDGVGHYRKTTITNYEFSGPSTVIRYTGYDATSGDLVINADGTVQAGYDVELPGADWILNRYSTRWVREGNETMGGEAHFDPANGLLRAERTWEQSISGTADITAPSSKERSEDDLVTFYRYTDGVLELERHFGADAKSFAVPTRDDWWDYDTLASLYPSTKQDYAVEYAYSSGMLSRKRVANQSVFEVYRTIDASTGWIEDETRNSGEVLAYSYDPMGRVRSIDSDRLADTVIEYAAPEGAQKTWTAEAKTYETLSDAARTRGGTALTWYKVTLDGLGRVATEQVRHPDSEGSAEVWSAQTTAYHPSGRIWTRSTLNNTNQNLEVHYDIKGRPIEQTLPGGDRIVHQYTGDRVRNDLIWINGAEGTESAVRSQVRRTFDALGRVVTIEAGEQVRTTQPDHSISTEFSGVHTTSFTYSPRGDTQSATRGSQTRIATHDGRGFLVMESIPEKGVTTKLTLHDTRGNPLQVKEMSGSAAVRTLNMAYDVLGRPTTLKHGAKTLKSWTYEPTCTEGAKVLGQEDLSACTGTNGQLASAERYNYRTPDDLGGGIGNVCSKGSCTEGQFRVQTSFRYDEAGRPNVRDLFVGYKQLAPSAGTELQSLRVLSKQVYDDLGRVTSVTYPCIQGTGADCVSDRTVDYTYDEALLKRVQEPGLGALFTYHLDGTVATITHDNGPVDTYTADALGRSRVASIELAKVGTASPLWSRAYSYDPAGNVKGIGGEVFAYDATSRLVDATIGTDTYHYEYDQYGNITNYGTVDQATNRLQGGQTLYDLYGNYISAGSGQKIRYDALDKAVAVYDTAAVTGCAGTCPGTFSVYDHNDLRIFTYRPGSNPVWTVRDSSGNLLREYQQVAGSGNKKTKDYVYAGSRLVSTETFDTSGASDGIRHYHQDHLGSARLVTGAGGKELLRPRYSPYGYELGGSAEERIGFTGHEKDGNGFTTYMKGRTFLGLRQQISGRPANTFSESGRFLQVDPGRTGWSQYAYASSNPINRVDRTGLEDGLPAPEYDGVDVVVPALETSGEMAVAWDTLGKIYRNVSRAEVVAPEAAAAMNQGRFAGRAALTRVLTAETSAAVKGISSAVLRGVIAAAAVALAADVATLVQLFVDDVRLSLYEDTAAISDASGGYNRQSATGRSLGIFMSGAEEFQYHQAMAEGRRVHGDGYLLSPYEFVRNIRGENTSEPTDDQESKEEDQEEDEDEDDAGSSE